MFGDDYNDLNMFDERFFKIAMENGCDELKAKADYVADENVKDGIYKACIKIWLDLLIVLSLYCHKDNAFRILRNGDPPCPASSMIEYGKVISS